MDISEIISTYKGGGTSAYAPRMMLKVVIFAYLNNVYSCRKIQTQLEQNIHYMWLSARQVPNFRTINAFRSNRLKDAINGLFIQVVIMLNDMGLLSLQESYIDGTKMESRANKYTFVWRGSVEKNREKLLSKVNNILKQIEEGIAQDGEDDDPTLPPFNKEEIKKRIDQINKENLTKKEQRALQDVEEKMLTKLDEYEQKLEKLGDRNSYSKTDETATFMRLKEDAMNNGQTKPAYNLQISTSNQFLTWYDMFSNPGDTMTFIPFLASYQNAYNQKLKETCADSGYGSEENYEYLEQNGIDAYVKYNWFHKEQHRPYKTNPFLTNNLYYNEQENYYVCPMGQHMEYINTIRNLSNNGFVSYSDIYEAKNYQSCPLKSQCHKGVGNRKIAINHNLNRLKKKAFDLLTSEEGLKRRSRRPIEPEAVFGQIKNDMHYKRFRHFSKDLVMMDFGILAMAFNLKKMWKRRGKLLFFCRFSKIFYFPRAKSKIFSKTEKFLGFFQSEKFAA